MSIKSTINCYQELKFQHSRNIIRYIQTTKACRKRIRERFENLGCAAENQEIWIRFGCPCLAAQQLLAETIPVISCSLFLNNYIYIVVLFLYFLPGWIRAIKNGALSVNWSAPFCVFCACYLQVCDLLLQHLRQEVLQARALRCAEDSAGIGWLPQFCGG